MKRGEEEEVEVEIEKDKENTDNTEKRYIENEMEIGRKFSA